MKLLDDITAQIARIQAAGRIPDRLKLDKPQHRAICHEFGLAGDKLFGLPITIHDKAQPLVTVKTKAPNRRQVMMRFKRRVKQLSH